jgi:hypothetical protein
LTPGKTIEAMNGTAIKGEAQIRSLPDECRIHPNCSTTKTLLVG